MDIQTTLFFNQNRWGWTETYYAVKSGLGDALVAANTLARARRKLMGRGSSIEAIRVSDVTVSGDSLVLFAADAGGWGSSSELQCDTPWNAWLARLSTGAMPRRSLYLRGIPDDWTTIEENGKAANVNAEFKKAWQGLVNVLFSEPYYLRALDKRVLTSPVYKIEDITVNDAKYVVLKVTGNALAVQDRVTVANVKGDPVPRINGEQIVKEVAGANVTLMVKDTSGIAYNYFGKGTIRKRLYTLSPITDAALERPVKKSTGRAFFGTRGRRSARQRSRYTPVV